MMDTFELVGDKGELRKWKLEEQRYRPVFFKEDGIKMS